MIDIVINPGVDIPIYQQLFESIRTGILTGKYLPDFCLPPIRTISKELGISVITVKKAWEELEHAGLIYSVTGRGCFVAKLHPEAMEKKKQELVHTRMQADYAYYRSFGLSKEDILRIFEKME